MVLNWPSLRDRTLSNEGKAGRDPIPALRSSGNDGTPSLLAKVGCLGVSPRTVGTSLNPTFALLFFIPSSEIRETLLAFVGILADSAGEYPLSDGFEGDTERGGGWCRTPGTGRSAKCADLAGLADGTLLPPGAVNFGWLTDRACDETPAAAKAAIPAPVVPAEEFVRARPTFAFCVTVRDALGGDDGICGRGRAIPNAACSWKPRICSCEGFDGPVLDLVRCLVPLTGREVHVGCGFGSGSPACITVDDNGVCPTWELDVVLMAIADAGLAAAVAVAVLPWAEAGLAGARTASVMGRPWAEAGRNEVP